jgi:RNA polymerase sigma factor (sigma-70 family)
MSATPVAALLHHVRRVLGDRPLPDGVLLEQFARRADEEAFAALMRRFGPLVWSVSLRGTWHEQDAEDVYQATFLLLARKAKSIRKSGSVSSWLYGVAHRLAQRTRAEAARRRQLEQRVAIPDTAASTDNVTWRELREVLDEELARLPEKYRAPLLLCYFEGMTQEEAARQLGWTPRSVKDRLERGRNRLRTRLAKRGVTLSMTLAGSMLAGGLATAAAPTALTETTLRAAVLFALRLPLAGAASERSLALARGGVKAMFAGKTSVLALGLVTALLLGGAGLVAGGRFFEVSPEAAGPGDGEERGAVDRYGDPLPPGAVIRLGTVRYRVSSAGAAFLPDGKTVAAAVNGGGIQLWDARTGRLLREIDTGHFAAGNGSNRGFAVSRDGKRLAAAGFVQGDGKPGFRSAAAIFDLATGKPVRVIERSPREGIHSLTISPDGKMLFTLDGNGKLRVEEVATGAELLTQQFPRDVMAHVTLSPDGSTIAVGSGPNTHKILVWKWQTAEEPREIKSGWHRGREVAISPDGKLLAECSDSEPDVRIFDVASGRLVHKLEQPDFEPYRHYSVVFSPNGNLLAASGGTNDRSAVNLWDPATGKFVKRLDIGGALAFSPDSSLLVAGSQVWDFAADKELSANPEAHRAPVERMVTGEKNLVVTTTGSDKDIRIWDATTGKQRLRIAQPGWIRDIALSPDGSKLASSSLVGDDSVSVWDTTTGKRIYRLAGHGRLGGRRAVRFTPDGKAVLSWGDDMYLRKWDMRNGKAVLEEKLRPTGVDVPGEDEDPVAAGKREMLGFDLGECRFTADAKHLILQAKGGFFVFDANNGKELNWFPGNVRFAIGMAVSPDGKLVAASSWGESIEIKLPDGSTQHTTANNHPVSWWNLAKGDLVHRVVLPDESAGPVAFAPDGKLLAVASSRPGARVRLIETETGRELRKIEGFRGIVRSLAFMPDGKRLVSGMEDSSALIWDLTRER